MILCGWLVRERINMNCNWRARLGLAGRAFSITARTVIFILSDDWKTMENFMQHIMGLLFILEITVLMWYKNCIEHSCQCMAKTTTIL